MAPCRDRSAAATPTPVLSASTVRIEIPTRSSSTRLPETGPDGRNLKVPGCFGHAGRAHALLGNIAEARAEIARLEGLGLQGFGVAYDLALIHVALKEPDAAITALERAVSDRSQMMGYMNVDPGLEPVLGDPRVREISRRIGFD